MDAHSDPGTHERSDRELVEELVGGSNAAMATLYDRYASMIHRVALSLNPDHGAAEETVQETFLALWNKAEQFDAARGSLPGWLATIARNRAIDRFRSAGRRAQATPFASVRHDDHDDESFGDWLVSSATVLAAGTPDPGPEAAFADKDTREVVTSALAGLTELERLTILLAYRDGLSQSEIAAQLGWPLGTVKTRSRRALRRLRQALEERGADEDVAAVARESTPDRVAAAPRDRRGSAVPCYAVPC